MYTEHSSSSSSGFHRGNPPSSVDSLHYQRSPATPATSTTLTGTLPSPTHAMCVYEQFFTHGLLLVNTWLAMGYSSSLPKTGALRLPFLAIFAATIVAPITLWIRYINFIIFIGLAIAVPAVWYLAPVAYAIAQGTYPGHEASYGRFRPTLFFCSTTHARFTPTKHFFKYPILYVGFPVTFKGSIGGLFGIVAAASEKDGPQQRSARTIFSVDPASFVNPTLPFDQKLAPILLRNVSFFTRRGEGCRLTAGKGLDPSLYPHTYIVTTPRFLGYAFNPVSYYYLYDAQEELRIVVVEANNTFGESQCYILNADDPTNPPARAGYTFRADIEKRFHISSFNHRSGKYEFHVRDPVVRPHAPAATVDMHMSVITTDNVKTMTARAYSIAPSFDMLSGSRLRGLAIALSWGYNNFLALPFTFFEAYRLYRKGTRVYIRPEPLAGTRRRVATKHEQYVPPARPTPTHTSICMLCILHVWLTARCSQDDARPLAAVLAAPRDIGAVLGDGDRDTPRTGALRHAPQSQIHLFHNLLLLLHLLLPILVVPLLVPSTRAIARLQLQPPPSPPPPDDRGGEPTLLPSLVLARRCKTHARPRLRRGAVRAARCRRERHRAAPRRRWPARGRARARRLPVAKRVRVPAMEDGAGARGLGERSPPPNSACSGTTTTITTTTTTTTSIIATTNANANANARANAVQRHGRILCGAPPVPTAGGARSADRRGGCRREREPGASGDGGIHTSTRIPTHSSCNLVLVLVLLLQQQQQ